MITLLYLGVLVLCVTGQYNSQSGGVLEENVACKVGYDCVSKLICVNGVIDVDGGGLISKRIKSLTCGGDKETCCRIPGYVEPLGEDQCNFNEDCVAYSICTAAGIIDISGGSLIDKRTGFKPPGTCINYEFPEVPAVCCLRPYKCPKYQECVQKHHCNVDGVIDKSGSLQKYLSNGINCISDDNSIEGVCCVPGKVKDTLLTPGKCGIRNNKNLGEYVQVGYGKEDAIFGEFPWQAIIFMSSNKDELLFKCAGTLISTKHVLTAAHCVELLKPNDIGVRLGEYEVSSVKELKPYADYNVHSINVHPEYSPSNTRFNLAIIELSKDVAVNYHIYPICLAAHGQYISSKCVATGWGKDNFEGNYQHILKKLELPLVEHKLCQSLLRKTALSKYFVLHPSLACAGGEAGQDTCTGDGGGPLACLDETSGQYFLSGIVNAGLKCGLKDVPGLYSNVPYMTDWIDSVVHDGGYTGPSAPSYAGK